MYLCIVRLFIGRRYPCEILDFACPCFLIQSLWIPLLGNLDRNFNEDFNERDCSVAVLASRDMQIPCNSSIRSIRRDERGQSNCGGISEELRNLSSHGLSARLISLQQRFATTSAILLIFSFRSFSEKPRSLFSPNRTLSPSRRYAARPRCKRFCSSAVAIVDLPEAERPVNHIVKPLWPLSALRSFRDKVGCHVIFLFVAIVRSETHCGVEVRYCTLPLPRLYPQNASNIVDCLLE